MKKIKVIAIFTTMIVSSHIFCMEKGTPKEFGMTILPKQSNNSRYKNLEFVLKGNLTTTNDIEYNATPPKLQYATLKRSIKDNDMVYLKLCLTYKFNPNRYRREPSLLHYAVKKCKPDAISILAQYNPDLVPLDEQQQTPLDYAMALRCEDCINEIAQIIGNKINELIGHRKHCGLTKHILQQGACEKDKRCCGVCADELIKQLKKYNLYETDDKATTQPLFITDNPITAESTVVTYDSDTWR